MSIALGAVLAARPCCGVDPEKAAEADREFQAGAAAAGHRLNPTQRALLRAADAQCFVYAAALKNLSADGTLPLFDHRVALRFKDPKYALAASRRLRAATERLDATRADLEKAIREIQEKTGHDRPGGSRRCEFRLQPFDLLGMYPPMQISYLGIFDLGTKLMELWDAPTADRKEKRELIESIIAGHGTAKGQTKEFRRRIASGVYEAAKQVAKEHFPEKAQLMETQKEFYANLGAGELDKMAPELHESMQDFPEIPGVNDYMAASANLGRSPGYEVPRQSTGYVNTASGVAGEAYAVGLDAMVPGLGTAAKEATKF